MLRGSRTFSGKIHRPVPALSLLGFLVETPGGASRKTKDQGLYNKPSAAVHPGALAAGTLPQYNTIQYNTIPADSSNVYLAMYCCI